MFSYPVLVGDIGGTNARFAMVVDSQSDAIFFDPVALADHETIEAVIVEAVLGHTSHWPKTMILAVAGPMGENDGASEGGGDLVVQMTNIERTVSAAHLAQSFALDEVLFMNDFAAQALAAVVLDREHLIAIGESDWSAEEDHGNVVHLRREQDIKAPKIVLGPGTGLGIACAVPISEGWVIIPGEGGHIDLGPRTKREFDIWQKLDNFGERICAEDLICGRGLARIYKAICRLDGLGEDNLLDEKQIVAALDENPDEKVLETCHLFLTLLGRVAGDLALLMLARGGVYLGGGVVPRMGDLIAHSGFRQALVDKEPYTEILRPIPSWQFNHPLPALVGLAAFARNPSGFMMNQAIRQYRPKP